jgi:hypothetical protein
MCINSYSYQIIRLQLIDVRAQTLAEHDMPPSLQKQESCKHLYRMRAKVIEDDFFLPLDNGSTIPRTEERRQLL